VYGVVEDLHGGGGRYARTTSWRSSASFPLPLEDLCILTRSRESRLVANGPSPPLRGQVCPAPSYMRLMKDTTTVVRTEST